MACPNGSVPLILPWTNTSASATPGTILSRGISFSVGTPAQPISMVPSTMFDNMFVHNLAECGTRANSSCIGLSGGVFDSAASTTFTQKNYAVWTGSRGVAGQVSAGSHVFFEDAIAFGLTPEKNKFPFFPLFMNSSTDDSVDLFASGELSGGATLPLGADSAFLNYLVDSGQASSRTYGLWVGSESERAPQDGLLVVGGYDESRIKSPGTTFPSFSDCATCATITAITYDTGDASTTLFAPSVKSMLVALDPYSPELRLPSDMLDIFSGLEKTAVWNDTSRRFELPATSMPTGMITITLSDMGDPLGDASKPSVATYKSTIPASELFRRPRAYNEAGLLEFNNSTVYNMALTNETSAARFATLGLPFFTQNYLIVDPDARNFQLAPALVAPADPKSADAKLKQVCRVLVATKAKSQAAALAGAVVGSIVGTLLLVAFISYLRRRKQKSSSQHSHNGSEAAIMASSKHLVDRLPMRSSSERKSLELPLQAPLPLVVHRHENVIPSVTPYRARSTKSGKDVLQEDPRRDLVHEVYRRVDEENDGRLLGERPLGLSETIHSRATLPRVAVEHEV